MSQNKKRQQQSRQPSSNASTENEKNEPETKNEPESQQTPTTEGQNTGDPHEGQETPQGDQNNDPDPDPQNDPDNPADEPVAAPERPSGGRTLPDEPAPDGRILEVGEELQFDGEQYGNMVLVKEDVYRKVYPRGTFTPSYVLLYRKGAQVPITSVQRR